MQDAVNIATTFVWDLPILHATRAAQKHLPQDFENNKEKKTQKAALDATDMLFNCYYETWSLSHYLILSLMILMSKL